MDTPTLSFSAALEEMKKGRKMSRLGWNGNGMFIQFQFPDANSKMTREYIYMTCPVGSTKQFGGQPNEQVERIPWLASQTDIVADDWVEILYTSNE